MREGTVDYGHVCRVWDTGDGEGFKRVWVLGVLLVMSLGKIYIYIN
jgi:hypothetical protein